MGFILKAIKSQLLKVIEWEDDSKNLIVYKFPMGNHEIMMGSKLIVRESQVAVFVNNGKIADVFMPGTYKLSTDNMPVLTVLMSWGYGFNSPFKAEVYFVNTKQFTGQKWGTQNPIMLRDKDFGMVRLRGYGVYSFKAVDGAKLLKELFGTNSSFETEEITEQLKSAIVSGLSDMIASSKISAIDLATNYNEFAVSAKVELQHRFSEIGLELMSLVIENLSLPEEVEKVLDERTKLGVLGDQMGKFTQYQAAQALKDAANNPSGNNFASMGVGLGAGVSMANVFNDAMRTSASDLKEESKPKQEEVKTKCAVCGAEIKMGAKFCPECGAKQTKVCPKCGASIKAGAKFCAECGEKQ